MWVTNETRFLNGYVGIAFTSIVYWIITGIDWTGSTHQEYETAHCVVSFGPFDVSSPVLFPPIGKIKYFCGLRSYLFLEVKVGVLESSYEFVSHEGYSGSSEFTIAVIVRNYTY